MGVGARDTTLPDFERRDEANREYRAWNSGSSSRKQHAEMRQG